jgi:hypothetical protein
MLKQLLASGFVRFDILDTELPSLSSRCPLGFVDEKLAHQIALQATRA